MLVRMIYNGRVKKGGRLNGIFMGEIGPDQGAPVVRYLNVSRNVPFYLVEIPSEYMPHIFMPYGKAGDNLFQFDINFILGKIQDAINNVPGPPLSPGKVKFSDNPGGLGRELFLTPFYIERFLRHFHIPLAMIPLVRKDTTLSHGSL